MRLTTALTLSAWLVLPLAGLSQEATPAEPAANPDLSGVWVINEEHSETMREKMREQMLAENDNPRVRARWDRLEARGRGGMKTAPFGRLTVEHADPELRITNLGGRVRDLLTDGSPLGPEEAYGVESATAFWEGAKLTIDSETSRGRITEFWELSQDGTTLHVTTQLEMGERFEGPVSFRRIYDLEPPAPEEVAAPPAEADEEPGG